jgi:FkbH-like protein
VAREGFSHPDSILKLSDFAAFKASWDPKHEAIAEIAHELNLGLESFVFVDDNPAEREIVSAQLPMVAVPNMSNDPSRYIDLLDRQLYFEPVGISAEDLQRSGFYASNVQRNLQQATFSDYGAFLDSLAMKAEVAPFGPTYLDRIVQLTNKTNQFNLTTRRYTAGEMDAVCADPQAITLYARLSDKFGENGIVSLAIARLDGEKAVIELWLMSCRVLKRELELLVLDELAARAAARGATTLVGYYRPTAKNRMVSHHYAKLGFDLIAEHSDGSSDWQLPLNAHYAPRCIHIKEVIRG